MLSKNNKRFHPRKYRITYYTNSLVSKRDVNFMLHVLKQQYNLISATRETLFTFLEEIPLEKLHSTVPNFGSGSIIKHIFM